MINIKDFRKQFRVSQKALAEELEINQSFISHIESGKAYLPEILEKKMIDIYGLNKIKPFLIMDKKVGKSSLLENAIGIKDYRSPEFIAIQQQLRSLLEYIEKETGLNEDEISMKIYGRSNMIRESVEGSKINKNMASYIFKHLNKLGIQNSSYTLKPLSSHSETFEFYKSVKNLIADEPKYITAQKLLAENIDENLSAAIKSEFSLSPIIQKGDILFLDTDVNQILIPGKPYFILLKDNTSHICLINTGKQADHYLLQGESIKSEKSKNDIMKMCRIISIIKFINP